MVLVGTSSQTFQGSLSGYNVSFDSFDRHLRGRRPPIEASDHCISITFIQYLRSSGSPSLQNVYLVVNSSILW